MAKHAKGPPRGRGRYSGDGRWWWDDGHHRWFRTLDQQDVLEVEAEDFASTSFWRGIFFVTGWGMAYYRFVGRARSADPRWPTYDVPGATFPGARPTLDDRAAQGAWLSEAEAALSQLHQRLLDEGWRVGGRGDHWWSRQYSRPVLDDRAPADTPEHPSRVASP